MNALALIGAGGHARSVLALLARRGLPVEGIYDDCFVGNQESILGIPVRGDLAVVPTDNPVVLACGDNASRMRLAERFAEQLLQEPLVHPATVVEPEVVLGPYCQVLGGVVVNACAVIGQGCLVNSGAVVEHEARVGAFCHISVNATLCGRAELGDLCFLGAGAVVKDKVRICRDVVIGANATVVQDITEPGVYVGTPARRLR